MRPKDADRMANSADPDQVLTHICLMDFSIFINWTSAFQILGVSGVIFCF